MFHFAPCLPELDFPNVYGSTANTAWVPARPFALHLLLFICLPQQEG